MAAASVTALNNNSEISVAAKWIAEADSVLVCAGAGMSATEGEAVYVSKEDFAKHYPFMKNYGYSTGYECMALIGDRNVPIEGKWAYFSSHYSNLRWNFKPNAGYDMLKRLIGDRDYFILTSNVDACFERAGFDRERIYTPQGDAAYYQCLQCCRPDSVFESKPVFDKMLETIDREKGVVDGKLVPTCGFCKGPVFMNLRGGGWFQHSLYDDQNAKFSEWVDSNIKAKKNIVVVEIGAGFNTPVITRLPVESVVREAQASSPANTPLSLSSLVRINPSDYETPFDLTRAVGVQSGWEVLGQIEDIIIQKKNLKLNEKESSSSSLTKGAEEGISELSLSGNGEEDATQDQLTAIESEYLKLKRQQQQSQQASGRVVNDYGGWRRMMSNLRS
jgi:NAD-dependent SIR2 family protein deacetylase